MLLNDILYKKIDGLAVITLNRPEMLNAFRNQTMQEFLDVLDDAAKDDGIRVIMITGNGRAFSAGVDLEEVKLMLDGDISVRNARSDLKRYQNVTRKMLSLPKPILAVLNGLAVGVGAEIALASDIRIASETAYFSFAEVKRALFETNGVMYFLPRLVGLGRAAAMLLTGDTVPAPDALQCGLVTAVFPPEILWEKSLEMAMRIAANAPISVRLVKQVLQRTYDLDIEAIMLLEEDGMLACLASDDLRESTNAFSEKRLPNYQGK